MTSGDGGRMDDETLAANFDTLGELLSDEAKRAIREVAYDSFYAIPGTSARFPKSAAQTVALNALAAALPYLSDPTLVAELRTARRELGATRARLATARERNQAAWGEIHRLRAALGATDQAGGGE